MAYEGLGLDWMDFLAPGVKETYEELKKAGKSAADTAAEIARIKGQQAIEDAKKAAAAAKAAIEKKAEAGAKAEVKAQLTPLVILGSAAILWWFWKKG